MPNPIPSKEDTRGLDAWCEDQWKVAEAALEAGFRLAVHCPPSCQVRTASMAARSLKLPVYMGYDAPNQKLLVWIDPEASDYAAE